MSEKSISRAVLIRSCSDRPVNGGFCIPFKIVDQRHAGAFGNDIGCFDCDFRAFLISSAALKVYSLLTVNLSGFNVRVCSMIQGYIYANAIHIYSAVNCSCYGACIILFNVDSRTVAFNISVHSDGCVCIICPDADPVIAAHNIICLDVNDIEIILITVHVAFNIYSVTFSFYVLGFNNRPGSFFDYSINSVTACIYIISVFRIICTFIIIVRFFG